MADEDAPKLDVSTPADTTPADTQPADTQPKPTKTPRAKTPRTPRTQTSRPRRARQIDIARRMEDMYVAFAAGIALVPSKPSALNPAETVTMQVSKTIVMQAPKIAAAWSDLAKENPRVAETLERILTVSSVGALLTAHLPIIGVAAAATGAAPPFVVTLIDVAAAEESQQ